MSHTAQHKACRICSNCRDVLDSRLTGQKKTTFKSSELLEVSHSLLFTALIIECLVQLNMNHHKL